MSYVKSRMFQLCFTAESAEFAVALSEQVISSTLLVYRVFFQLTRSFCTALPLFIKNSPPSLIKYHFIYQ